MPVDDSDSPQVVAMRFDEDAIAGDLARWCGGHVATVDAATCVWVPSASGHDRARYGDWIVRVAEGEFLVMTPEQFAARMEPLPADEVR